MNTWWLRKLAQGIAFITIAAALFGFLVMALWNTIIPEIFKGPELTFWQALGLLVLSHLLLRGWAPWHWGSGWRHEQWRRKFAEKLAAMTPEEREKFKKEWRQRCGRYPEETHG